MDLTGVKSDFIDKYIKRIIKSPDYPHSSQADIARALEIKPQYLNLILRGERNVSDKFLKKFTQVFRINQNDLFQYEEKEYPSNINNLQSVLVKSGIPLVKAETVGSFGNESFIIEKQDILGHYIIPDFTDASFMIQVRGESMLPRYNSGDLIACRVLKNSQFIQWNEIHVITTMEQGVLIKRLRKGSSEKALLAVSDNPEYQPFEIPTSAIISLALVLGGIRFK